MELLPFHKMGEFKWAAMKEKYALEDVEEPSEEAVSKAAGIFKGAGLPVVV